MNHTLPGLMLVAVTAGAQVARAEPQPRPYSGAYQGTAGIKVQGTNGSFSMTVY